ncbi:Hypothetical predicted protein [Cloeon dipterum]|uniref:Uncharacterized protein n=1 Tax=Cloeon dipterum TaxID=197152 RepID=A0A8S1BZK2_9INSE|nr:Hypothetical predicted protein [Cloeon dipterum]
MYQQPSRQPRHSSGNNMQPRSSQNRQPHQPQQQTQMAMPMVSPMNQTQFASPVYPYQSFPFNVGQYPSLTVVHPPNGMMLPTQMPMPVNQQPRYQTPMAPTRMMQPMQPRQPVPHPRTRSRAIAIVDPTTMKEVNVNADTSENAAIEEQVNGEEKAKTPDVPVVNGTLPEKQEERVDADQPSQSVKQVDQPHPQEPTIPSAVQNTQTEVKQTEKRMPKPKRGPRQDSSRKSSTASPELTRKSPEPSSSISPPPPPAQPVAQEPPMEEADEDGGSWQEAKPRTRGSKKKSEQRNAPERQQLVNDRQQRRKDTDKKGPRVKPFSGPSNYKAAPEKPAESSTPQPPPVISYKDRLLGKKEEKRTPEPVTGVAPVAAHVAAAPAPVSAPVAATRCCLPLPPSPPLLPSPPLHLSPFPPQ